MIEIGEKLKVCREELNLPIEEVAQDLKIKKNLIESIEKGNKEDFNDIYELKECIEKYSKYLGVNHEELATKFDEYLFDCTSKIPICDIKTQFIEEKKIKSPYTIEVKKKNKKMFLFVGIGVIVLSMVLFFVLGGI